MFAGHLEGGGSYHGGHFLVWMVAHGKLFLIDHLTQETECLGQLVLHVQKNWGVTFAPPVHCLGLGILLSCRCVWD